LWGTFVNIDFLYHLALPLLSAVLYYLSLPLLIMRSSMIAALGSDYLLIAKAKGLSNKRILFKHAARNALLPVITIFSLLIGYAMGGQVVLETVYSWPGMGLAMVEAVQHHDYPVAQATFGLMAILIIVLNFITDIVYCFLDPRIRY
jgi:peptide/nickel transport system permease protein